jgi:hypothetical protein
MATDYEKLDFQTILDQITWMNSCDTSRISRLVELQCVCLKMYMEVLSYVDHVGVHFRRIVSRVEQEFRAFQQKAATLNEWASWMQEVSSPFVASRYLYEHGNI